MYTKAVHGDTACGIWQDKKIVQMLLQPQYRVMEYMSRRRPVAKSKWLKGAVAKHWRSLVVKVLMLPAFAVDYNCFTNGVDIHD